MIRLNIHEAKTHLSRYLQQLGQGETLLLCKHNKPIAEVRPLAQRRRGKRPIGLGKGEFSVPDSFFDDLPDDILDGFEGR